MLRRLVLPLFLFLLSAAAGADTLLTLRSHTDGFEVMGQKQEAKDTQVKMWVGQDRLRRDEDEQSMILRLDRNKLYILNHPAKTYSEVALPVDLRKLMPPGNEALADQVANGMKLDVQVKPGTETRKVGTWTGRRVDVAIRSAMGMKIDTILWVSQDVGAYKALNRLGAAIASLQPGATAWAKQLEQIDGFPVRQESTVDALGAKFKTWEELVSVEAKDAAAGLYEPPAGYKAAPFNPIAGMSR